MKTQFFASIAAIPFAIAGVFAHTHIANAAALTGEFHLGSGSVDGKVSNIFLTKDSLSFTPTPTPVMIDADTNGGTFSNFNSAYITEIVSFNSSTTNNPFLDFGYLELGNSGIETPGDVYTGLNDDSSLKDGLNVFNLEQASYQLNQSGDNVAVDVALWGSFVSETGEETDGAGNLTFQINDTTIAEVQGKLDGGEKIGGLTFSGGLFSESKRVPEPTTLFGLGVVAAGLIVSRRNSKNN